MSRAAESLFARPAPTLVEDIAGVVALTVILVAGLHLPLFP